MSANSEFKTPPEVDAPAMALDFRERRWVPFFLAFSDLLCLEAAILGGYLIRLALKPWLHILLWPSTYVGVVIAVLSVPIGYFLVGLYPGYGLGSVERFSVRGKVTLLMFLGFIAWDAILQGGQWSRGLLLITFVLVLVLIPAVESLVISQLEKRRLWGTPVVVIGHGYSASALFEGLQRERRLGFVPVAYFDDDESHWGGQWHGVPVIGAVARAGDLAQSVKTAIIAVPEDSGDRLAELTAALPYFRIIVVPDLGNLQSLWVTARDLGGIVGIEVTKKLLIRSNRLIKRTMDLLLAGSAIVVASPIIAVAAAAVRAASRGSPFYFQIRQGMDGKPIKVWKLRTMYDDAEARLDQHLAENPEAKAEWDRYVKLSKDPRIVPVVGHFLRRWSLDEVPQLWNVMAGDMSLVGPRPFPDYHLEKFDGKFRALRQRVRPGITGLWQISARSDGDLSVQEGLDTYYIRNWSLWLDLHILYYTLAAVVMGRGAR